MSVTMTINRLSAECGAMACSLDEATPNTILISDLAYYALIGELRDDPRTFYGEIRLITFRGMRICRGIDMGFEVGVFHKRADGQMKGCVA